MRTTEVSPALTRLFSELYGTYGYAFARIEPRQDIDRKTGQVVLVSSGGGRHAAACDNIVNDNFTANLSYDGRGQGREHGRRGDNTSVAGRGRVHGVSPRG